MNSEDCIKQLDIAKIFLASVWIPYKASIIFNNYKLCKYPERTMRVLEIYVIN